MMADLWGDSGQLDLGIVRDSDLYRTNNLHVFMESWIGLYESFTPIMGEATKVFRTLAEAVFGDMAKTRAAIAAGVTEADIRSFETVNGIVYARLWNHRRIQVAL